MQDPLASWSAIGVAIATFIVALFALFNVIIAKNSLRLMQQREERSQPALRPYLVNYFMKRLEPPQCRLYYINLSVSNDSDTNTSLREINLAITYNRTTGINSNISIPLLPTIIDLESCSELVGKNPSELLTTPTPINPHGVIRGWAVFKIDESVLCDVTINSYQLKIIDIYNIESSLNILVMQEQN